MFEQLGEAIERQDYSTAYILLEQLQEKERDNPWLYFYIARLNESKGMLSDAEQAYRDLLRYTTNSKILVKARQGLQRLIDLETQKQQEIAAISETAKTFADFENVEDIDTLTTIQFTKDEPGVLILEAIEPELKQGLAAEFARIINIDVYSARLQLPSRSWRLYRYGSIRELESISATLLQANIPCFCLPLNAIQRTKVYQVSYFESIEPTGATVIYLNRQEKVEQITFNWTEIDQRVEGAIPLFEDIVDTDNRGKTYRKTQISDYTQVCDLQLPGQNIILRLCDRTLKFDRGIKLLDTSASSVNKEQVTARNNWHHLHQLIEQHRSDLPVYSEFSTFAETALDFREILKHLEPNLNLLRREESLWDAAFQLYSSLVLLKNSRSVIAVDC